MLPSLNFSTLCRRTLRRAWEHHEQRPPAAT
jgi:hypothetical protein